jgi:hypothetical protein
MPKTLKPTLLEELLDPVMDSLNEEAAKRLIALKAGRKLQKRVDELAEKCNEGTLTAQERADYESIVAAGNFIGILKAKARFLLAKNRK